MEHFREINIALAAYGVLISLFMLICQVTVFERDSKQARLIIRLVACNFVAVLADMFAWIVDGSVCESAVAFARAMRCASWILSYMLLPLVTDYIISLVKERDGFLKMFRRFMYAAFAVSAALVVVSEFNDMYFYIEDGVYKAGEHFWISQAIGCVLMFCCAAILFAYRGRMNKIDVHTVALLGVFPMIAIVLQTFFANMLELLFVSTTLSIVAVCVGSQMRQQKIIEANKNAEAYVKLKQNILAEMGHELRTPLAVLSGYAQYAVEEIQKKGVSPETIYRLNTVSQEARRLADLANNTLDHLKEIREVDKDGNVKLEPVNVYALMQKVTAVLKPLAQKNGVTLQTRIDADLQNVGGNTSDFTRVIWNILQNAILHSNADAIKISAQKSGDIGVALKISDNGIGISRNILNRIFERGVSGVAGRSGLGLYISREIITKYNGKILIDSEKNAGTEVTIFLRNYSNYNDLPDRGGRGV